MRYLPELSVVYCHRWVPQKIWKGPDESWLQYLESTNDIIFMVT